MLRAEAALFLRRVQELPRFGPESAKLRVPTPASDWRWGDVAAVSVGAHPGKVRWEWVDLDELDRATAVRALKEIKLRGADPDHLWRFSNGHMAARLPTYLPEVTSKVRADVHTYFHKARRFAADYLLGAQWAPRALHDALRADGTVVLPCTVQPWLRLPEWAQTVLEPKRPVSRDVAQQLAEAIDEDVATGPSELRGSRQTTWARALEVVRKRLDGEATTPTERSARARAARYLDGAVNGELGAPPLEPSDDRRWVEGRLRRLRAGDRLAR